MDLSKLMDIMIGRFMRKNNFNLIRLMATCFVMAGHMGATLGVPLPSLGSEQLQMIGVQVLFIMGGYLISNSWRNDPHVGRYFLRRFLRLWPPFAIMVLLLGLVAGPLLSNLGPGGYFSSGWTAWLKNLVFFPVFGQPGVFESNPIPHVSNGSIWTMPVEAAAYLLTPVLLFIFGNRGKHTLVRAALIAALFYAADLILIATGAGGVIFFGTEWVAGFHLIACFVIGMFCGLEVLKKHYHLQAAPIVIFVLLLTTEIRSAPVQQAVWLISLPYLVFSLAFAEKPLFWKLGGKMELSYGIYLYGFFFQQLVVMWNLKYALHWDYMVCLAVSMALSVGAAVVNCLLIENPLQKLSRSLTSSWKARENTSIVKT